MNQQPSAIGRDGELAYGLAQTASDSGATLTSQLVVVPAQMVYLHIPAADLRNFVDGVFPDLAKNRIADSAVGFGHRYRAGHDLFLDVPRTFNSHGPFESLRHAGHIILTDFPTKAGIPIPGFSQAGLGHLLEQAGISSGWLQVSLFDTGVGIFAIADGSSSLYQALQGTLSMDFGTACQTFGVGSVELGFGIATQNPLLVTGGLENFFAGLISTWNTYTVYVDPLDFLGAAGTSALLGFGIAHGIAGRNLRDSTLDAARSGTVGALYSISSAFGFGALAGFIVYRLASKLAEGHNLDSQKRLTVDRSSYELLVEALCSGNLQVQELLNRTAPKWIESDLSPLSRLRVTTLSTSTTSLDTAPKYMDVQSPIFSVQRPALKGESHALPNDPARLSSVYLEAFAGRLGAK